MASLNRCPTARRFAIAPNSALTRFLKQGLARGICPLCRVVYKIDREYIWAFFDEYSQHDSTLNLLRRSRGLCADHAEQLRRLEVDGLRSTLGIGGVYLDTFQGLAEELAGVAPDDELPAAGTCPACAYRDEEVAKNLGYLLELVMSDRHARERFQRIGLCLPHFAAVWERASAEERRLLLGVERAIVEQLVVDLAQHIRKQGHEVDEEQTPDEARSWSRAVQLTTGWSREAQRQADELRRKAA